MNNPFRKRGLNDILANFKSILNELEMLSAGCNERASSLLAEQNKLVKERDDLLAEAKKANDIKANIKQLIKE